LVVELATYDDNLRRQIQPQSAGESLDLYKLPVDTIVEMAVQILDVMDYLHKKLRCAYTDWKPEHIYWNDAVRQVKLIDWNATIPLSGGLGDKQTIREDIRMFCGAVLYCSLALSDPEELTRPIGPPPTVPKDLIRLIPPRYWTDKPNFYERDYILDEEIKRLVQKGLDPKQGFNSPQELKIALIQYIERSSKQSIGYIGKSSDQDLFSKLPHNHDAVQYYRRARSYIATNDFSLAIISLEIAIAAAKAEGIEHPEAEQLLKSAQASEARQSAKQALESEKWKDALNLYARAVSLDPTNAMLRKEFDSLRGLLHAESKLRNKSIQRIFISPSQLQTNLIIVKGIVSANKPLLNYIEKQLHWIRLMRIRLVRIGGLGMLIALLLIIMSEGIKLNNIPYIITGTHPPTSTSTITSTITSTVTVTPTITVSPTITVTHTLEPTPTIVLGYGRLIAFFFALETPNGKRIEPGLRKNQQITIVDSRLDYGDLWYKCIWEEDGLLKEGWILGKYIEFGTRPITTATP
jgi:tetratricopeptide (TPR) repeat protein